MVYETEMTEKILIAMRRVIRAIDRHSKNLVQSHGLTGPQALLLTEIVRSGSLTGSELAKRVSLSQATVTDVVKRLEGRKLLDRKRDTDDKRRVLLRATEQGEVLVKQSVPLLQEKFQNRLGELKDWEQNQLLSSLQRIAEMMNAEDLDAAPMLTSGAITASPEAIEEAVTPQGDDQTPTS
ncbi:MAG: MarR family transcriptional regulator [Candidatus Thiodiazotropha sp. (ex Notomyrtea botanica)]|nr:MarR family transcriptional regulator [Candidatus Thiodiazotropha sp. (ex Notomyrtea botanica)]